MILRNSKIVLRQIDGNLVFFFGTIHLETFTYLRIYNIIYFEIIINVKNSANK